MRFKDTKRLKCKEHSKMMKKGGVLFTFSCSQVVDSGYCFTYYHGSSIE